MLGLLLAQALVEHGMLDSIASGVGQVRYRIDAIVGEGNSTYLLLGGAAVILFLVFRRRR